MSNSYHWKRGHGTVAVDLKEGKGQPEHVPVSTHTAGVKLSSQGGGSVRCTVCQKVFKKPVVMANHFRREHRDVDVAKDAWREHSEPVNDAE